MRRHSHFKIALLAPALVVLCACQPTPTDYFGLMTHPEIMEQDLGHCQGDEKIAVDCEVVRRAAGDFAALVSDRAANPEGFGMKILAAETALGVAETASQQASGDAYAAQAYTEQQRKVAILLAVVSATSLVGN